MPGNAWAFPFTLAAPLLLLLNGNLPDYPVHIFYKDIITSVPLPSETENNCNFSQIRSCVWLQRQCRKVGSGAWQLHHPQGSPRSSRPATPQAAGRSTLDCFTRLQPGNRGRHRPIRWRFEDTRIHPQTEAHDHDQYQLRQRLPRTHEITTDRVVHAL